MSKGIDLGQRKIGHRTPSKRIVIIVEGRSEKIYFERFRTSESPIAIRIHESKDRTAEGMVAKCLHLIERSGLNTDVDEVIAVFDADRNAVEDIEEAVKTCSKNNVTMYISNPSFEFWLLLHFEDDKTTYIQEDLEKRLEKYIKAEYKKSEGINRHIGHEHIEQAIARSKSLLPEGDPVKCKNTMPSTCIHILVEKLINKQTNKR
ncbi:MAG: RloB family protein [Methanomassiliicoccaceae archaeon]|nr:RloB family protein [Methanomassiliicoccaceae archaeon]